jgi:phage terminase large subunit-like protein
MRLTPEEKEAAVILAELERRQKEEYIRYAKPFEKQRLFHLCGKRNSWALGGNRTGKTEGGAMKAVIYALGDRAQKYMEDWPEDLRREYMPLVKRFGGKPTRGWIGSVSFEVQRDVTQKKLLGDPETGQPGLLPITEIKRKKNGDLAIVYRSTGVIDLIYLVNGSVIGFKSYDQGREKFQGTSQHWIWLDEEPPKEIYTECQMRVMDTIGDIFGTMTPLQGLTWVYDDIYLNDSKPVEKQDKEIYCILMQWDDNPYLTDEEKRRLEASMDSNELEARKYGRFIMPGKCSFDQKALTEMLKMCRAGERGNLKWEKPHKSVKWEPDPDGEFEVWFKPDSGTEYITPGDVAEGLEHGDFDAVGVINRKHMRLDAVYHGKVDPDVLAEKVELLSVWYGRALASPERNNHGISTINELKKTYSNIYQSEVYDQTTNKTTKKLGWLTTPKTRPIIIDALKKAIRERHFICYWRRFVDEAMNFIRHPDGKERAREGFWDDAVLMAAIGVHLHQTAPLLENQPPPHKPGGSDKPTGNWSEGRRFMHPERAKDLRRKEWAQKWGEDDE